MARRLFEIQAARSRIGALANSAIYVVYSDAAGTVPADIAASVDGTAISGSVVTTSDISGLGPGSARFYGPPSGTDTLYVRSSSDATLGVQKIRADLDERVDALEAGGTPAAAVAAHQADTTAIHGITDTAQVALRNAANTFTTDNTFNAGALFASGHPWVDAAAFVQPSDAGDDALALQRAIDYAQTLVASSTKAPMVVLTGDEYHWSTPITAKSAAIVGLTTLNNGCRVYWEGGAGSTVITKSAAFAGGTTYWELSGISFIATATEPTTWLDLTADGVDAGCRLQELQFAGGTGDAIKVGSWINLHWRHLRFDNVGGYAIRATPGDSSQNLSSFLLDGFTYDHSRGSGPASGCFMVDNSVGATNLGVFAIKNGRIEGGTAWTGNQAVVTLKLPDSAPPARSLGVYLENITYSPPTMANDVLLYQETATTTLVPSLVLVNVRQNSLSAIIGGGLPTTQALPPVQSTYPFFTFSSGGYSFMSDAIRILVSSSGGTPISVRSGAETVDRFTMDQNGKMSWGGGAGAVDVVLERGGADLLKLNDALWVTSTLFADTFVEMPEQGADPAAPAANKVRIYPKDVGGKTAIFARFPTGAAVQIAIEP